MEKVNLCGNEVSRLGFGCMRFPTINGKVDEKTSLEMLESTYSAGVNYFDTAYIYLEGQSEGTLAKFIKTKRNRSLIFIADKLPMWLVNKPKDMQQILPHFYSSNKNKYKSIPFHKRVLLCQVLRIYCCVSLCIVV